MNSIEPSSLTLGERVKGAVGLGSTGQPPIEETSFVQANLPHYRDRGPGRRTYYADHTGQKEVLDVRPNSISTVYNDAKTVQAVLELAEAKGWTEIRARGSESFRREVAIQGAVRNIQVEGYKLTQMDRQEIAQRSGTVVQMSPQMSTKAAAQPSQQTTQQAQQASAPEANSLAFWAKEAAFWAKEAATRPATAQQAAEAAPAASKKRASALNGATQPAAKAQQAQGQEAAP